MLFVLNKKKIVSYTVAFSIVVILFLFSLSVIPNQNIELIQVSSNTNNNINNLETKNNNIKNENNDK